MIRSQLIEEFKKFDIDSVPEEGLVMPVEKPIGISTFDVIRTFKRTTGYRGKVGHGGTLDVFASGVVLLLIGKATKRFDEFQTFNKRYIAGVRIGAYSETLDIEGEISDFKSEKNRS